jgi:hypothetical protein
MIWFPLAVAIVAAVVYVITTHPRVNELARLAFAASFLVLMWMLANTDLVVGAVHR